MMDGGTVGTAPHVMIVEDEDNIALALTTVLKREGWHLTRVADGADAVEAIRSGRPDLVLLDVMLPHVSGYEICQSVRLDPALAETRILVMTARGTVMERRKGLALGADGFLSKPFPLTDLLEEARRLLAAPRACSGTGVSS